MFIQLISIKWKLKRYVVKKRKKPPQNVIEAVF
jgi:hypothetical protein